MRYALTIVLLFIACNVFAQEGSSDWANLTKYAKEDSLLAPPKAAEDRVVFIGSSIIEFWKQLDPAYFADNHFVNRGISGQLSPQLLIRFRADVINLKPRAVVILAGSNDLARDTSALSYVHIMNNIRSMVELAKYNHIKVFLCTYLPIADYPWRKGLHPAKKIMALNQMISDYARKQKVTILDYFTPLVDKENGQKADLTRDGVHPNLRGYKALEVATDKVMARWKKNGAHP